MRDGAPARVGRETLVQILQPVRTNPSRGQLRGAQAGQRDDDLPVADLPAVVPPPRLVAVAEDPDRDTANQEPGQDKDAPGQQHRLDASKAQGRAPANRAHHSPTAWDSSRYPSSTVGTALWPPAGGAAAERYEQPTRRTSVPAGPPPASRSQRTRPARYGQSRPDRWVRRWEGCGNHRDSYRLAGRLLQAGAARAEPAAPAPPGRARSVTARTSTRPGLAAPA